MQRLLVIPRSGPHGDGNRQAGTGDKLSTGALVQSSTVIAADKAVSRLAPSDFSSANPQLSALPQLVDLTRPRSMPLCFQILGYV